MIVKVFELNKIDIRKNHFFLFYGENQGHKNEVIKERFKKDFLESIYYYDEVDIINNKENFFNDILSKSFFETKKLIIISRATDRIKDVIEEIITKNIEDLVIIINANTLEKKSKLRSFFEKEKKTICVAFYEDNSQTLSGIANLFFRKNKIPMSQQSINLVVERCRGDRQNLYNELLKIENFIGTKKQINIEDLIKLTNLAENYNVSELVDSCLAKNQKKTSKILNENNYSLEDCILIIRTLLLKSKRLLKLSKDFNNIKSIDLTILNFKPPIFWKDKDIVKKQIKSWTYFDVKNLIYRINETELLIKKNSNNALNILSDFIIEQSTIISNEV
jgi:DNA polymerase-3 subunit delta